jgi:hypothetical protein
MPISTGFALNTRFLTDNPFIEPIEVRAEVFYNSMWFDTGWNDQIGIKATYSSSQEDKVIVQSGLMGTIACGQESGNGSGLTYPTVVAAVKTRVIVTPLFR